MMDSNFNIQQLIAARLQHHGDNLLTGHLSRLTSGLRISGSPKRCFKGIRPASLAKELRCTVQPIEPTERPDRSPAAGERAAHIELDASRVELENISAADRAIQDPDFAVEVAGFTRPQILARTAQHFPQFS